MKWIKIVLSMALVAVVPLQSMAEEPKKIQDNSFLLEEAYNQEDGVVQHIQMFQYFKKSKKLAIYLYPGVAGPKSNESVFIQYSYIAHGRPNKFEWYW